MAKQIQSLQQRLNLSPRQILEADILQLNVLSLEKKINDEIESNPILEIDDENSDHENNSEEEDSFDWDELSSNPDEYDIQSNPNSKKQMIENMSLEIDQKNLVDDMLFQLVDTNASDDEIKIAREVLGNLNEHGFLSIESILIADRMEIDEKKVQDVVEKIKNLDPPGIASSDIKECIIAQLNYFYPDDRCSIKIISSYYEDFINRRYDNILNKGKISERNLAKTVDIVSSLNPYPAINYFSGNVEHIIPDIIAERQDGHWQVTVNSHICPNIRINNGYLEMLGKHKGDKNVKNFLKKKLDSANWFISAIEQRNITYEKVMKSIIKHQNDYFNSDNKILAPLILKDIADDIKMDISTISRTTNGKYVQTPWGIKELKMFFSEGVKTKDGSVVSSHEVRKAIEKIISNEDKTKPLNDEKITAKINEIGYLVARRTVSKYRESLSIPVSRLRKQI